MAQQTQQIQPTNSKLSAQQRAALFAQMTRQMKQMLPSQKVDAEMQTVQFTLPKSRLLSKIWLEVDAIATLKSSNASIPKSVFSPYEILRRVSVDLNNGFSPFVVSGRDLLHYNLIRINPDVLFPQSNSRGLVYVENEASAGGKDAKIKFQVELPITLNDRDPVGLILLQNPETQVTLTVDIDKLEKAYAPTTGDEVVFKSMTITPMIETFSVPPVQDAFPDITVLKLVHGKRESFNAGQNVIKLTTGTIYRKLVLFFEDENGAALENTDFSGNIEIIFNQADIPYSIKPSVLSGENHSQLGYALPSGLYVFDFSFQGSPNYGGSRDYIDTERLTEFWIRFNASKAGIVTAVSETLTRLR